MDAKSRESPFEAPVDSYGKCIEIRAFSWVGPLLVPRCGRRRSSGPHNRGLWASASALTLLSMGWFALPPLLLIAREDIGLCDNDEALQQNLEDVCECGASCRRAIAAAGIASVLLDGVARLAMSSAVERLGPRMSVSLTLLLGLAVVAGGSAVTGAVGLIVVRGFTSMFGAALVAAEFWLKLLFAGKAARAAHASAWGCSGFGAGLAQVLMPAIYLAFHEGAGLDYNVAWRIALLLPAGMMLLLVAGIPLLTLDTPQGGYDVVDAGKTLRTGPVGYLQCLKDARVLLLVLQFSACYGCEMALYNALALHLHDHFGLGLMASGALAASFGLPSLLMRPWGGTASSWANKRWSMPGRLRVHFLALLGQALAMFALGSLPVEGGWLLALPVLLALSLCNNVAQGTSYALIPFAAPPLQRAALASLVWLGGTMGALLSMLALYIFVEDTPLAFHLISIYMLLWSVSVFFMRWESLGSMFGLGTDAAPQRQVSHESDTSAQATAGGGSL